MVSSKISKGDKRMKKVLVVLASVVALAVPTFAMDASFKMGDGTQSRLMFGVEKDVSVGVGLSYMELHGKVGVSGSEASISGSALMPSIGVEYSMPATKNVSIIIGGEYQHVFPSFKMDFMNNPMVNMVNDAVDEVLKNTTINQINIYTGLNVKLSPVLSVNGTTGIRLLNGTYSKDGIDLNLGMNSVYTQLGILVSL